jgi:hypothetical protein
MNAVLKLPARKPLRTGACAITKATPTGLVHPGNEPFVDPVRRREMVAEAAYFNAQHRGFRPGHELDDWLAAENQVDASLTLDRVRAVYGDP